MKTKSSKETVTEGSELENLLNKALRVSHLSLRGKNPEYYRWENGICYTTV